MANDAFLVELKFFFVGFFMFCINKEKRKIQNDTEIVLKIKSISQSR